MWKASPDADNLRRISTSILKRLLDKPALNLRVLRREGRYLVIKYGRWRGLYDPNHREVLELLESDEPLRQKATRLFKLSPNIVAEVTLSSELRVIVKDFGWRNFLHFWASPFVKSKALRSLEIATHLLQNGLLTPRPLGAFEQRNEGLIEKAYFITESLGETDNVREFLQLCPEGGEERRRILTILADYVRQMHDCGLLHRDLTLANFLIKDEEVYLIDLTRARVKTRLPVFQKIEDIAKMELAPADHSLLFNLYWGNQKGRRFWYRLLCLRVALYQTDRRLKRLRRRVRRFF